jgi:acyl carrier protein
MEKKVEALVHQALQEFCGVPKNEVKNDATFNSYNLDELDLMDITLFLEEELDICIEDDAVTALPSGFTVQNWIDMVVKTMGQRHEGVG